MVTFAVVPLELRVAFVAVKNFFWGGYLSWAAAAADQGAHDAKAEVAVPRRLARMATH